MVTGGKQKHATNPNDREVAFFHFLMGRGEDAAALRSYPHVAPVGRADAPLHVNALRPLGLLCWDGTDQGGVVFAGHVADEGTH